MNIFFSIIPFIISILVVITKKKIVNAQSGEKFALREMILDVLKVIVIAAVALIANIVCGKNIPIWTLIIDIFMLIIYLLPLMQKNYDYVDRKALRGIWASCVFMLIIATTIFQMLIGIYDPNDTALIFCFFKGISYFSIAIWCCFTAEKDHKIRALFLELRNSIKNYKLSRLDYYAFAFLGLFIFAGGNGNIPPIGIFGVHEICNKKVLKGILYIISGNISLFLQYKYPLIGSITFVIYTLVAFIDLLVQFIRDRKFKSQQ